MAEEGATHCKKIVLEGEMGKGSGRGLEDGLVVGTVGAFPVWSINLIAVLFIYCFASLPVVAPLIR